MDVTRKGTLPGTSFATDQNNPGVLRNPARLLPQLLHDLGLSDRHDHGTAMFPQVDIFPLQPVALKGALDRQQQLCQRYRFLDEIVGTKACGLNRGLDCPVARHHDHRTGQFPALRPLAQQGNPVYVLHPDIQQDQVRSADAAGLARSLATISRRYAVTFVFQDFVDEIPDVRFIVNYEYMSACHFLGSVPAPRSGATLAGSMCSDPGAVDYNSPLPVCTVPTAGCWPA